MKIRSDHQHLLTNRVRRPASLQADHSRDPGGTTIQQVNQSKTEQVQCRGFRCCHLQFLMTLLFVFFSGVTWEPNRLRAQNSNQDLFPAPSGVLTRSLEQAKESLSKADYPEAVERLAAILQADDSVATEDYFLPTRRQYSTKSIRRQARDLIGNMPARGRAFYELKYGIAAKKKLEQAIGADDTQSLAEVANRYFHTKASYVATLLLGKEKLFHGDFQFAHRYFYKLVASANAKQLLDPEISILSAITLAKLGDMDEAASLIHSLKVEFPVIRFRLGDRFETYTIGDIESAKDWIAEFAQSDQSIATPSEIAGDRPVSFDNEWLQYRSADRLSESTAGPPLAIAQWQVPITTPANRQRITELQQQLDDNQLSGLTCLNAVSLKNTVVFRSSPFVVGVDVTTGKRIWTYPWNDQSKARGEDASLADPDSRLKQAFWSDHLAGSIVADGEQVYFVESPPRRVPADRRRTPFQKSTRSSPNSLIALRVVDEQGASVEGQLAWKIDGRITTSELKGCRFLGPPLIKDESAYVIVELAGQVRLVALRARNGEVLWSQQLASTQSHDDPEQREFRYQQVATPVHYQGLLICPTLMGGLVAVDLSDRTLKWGAKFDTKRYLGTRYGRRTSSWHDNAMFFVDGYLVYSPVESSSYQCINPELGRRKFIKAKGDLLYLAGKYKNNLVAVSATEVELLAVTGFGNQKINIAEYGPVTGLGIFSGSTYLLPTAKGLLAIDLSEKKIAKVYETGTPLGNLMSFQGRLLSLSAHGLSAFYQEPYAKEWVNSQLESSASNPELFLTQAQLLAAQGKDQEAIEATIRSMQFVASAESEEFLTSMLISRISRNKDLDWADIDRAAKLVRDPKNQRRLLLTRIDSLFQNGQGTEAIDDVLRLVEIYATGDPQRSELFSVTRTHQVQELRLVRMRIKSAFEVLAAAEQQTFQSKLEQTYLASLKLASPGQTRILAELFGDFSFVQTHQSDLVGRMVRSAEPQDLLWTESFLLEQLGNAPSAINEFDLLQQLSAIYESQFQGTSSGHFDPRQMCFERQQELIQQVLLAKYPQQQDRWNRELRTINLQLVKLQKQVQPAPTSNDGMAKVSLMSADEGTEFFVDISGRKLASQRVTHRSVSSRRFKVEATDEGDFIIRDGSGRWLYQNSVRKRGGKYLNLHYESTHYQVLGGLLVLSFGYDHVGVDLTKLDGTQKGMSAFTGSDDFGDLVGEANEDYDEPILWRYNSFEPVSGVDRQLSRLIRESNSLNIIVERKVDFAGNRIGRTSWLSLQGLCLLNKSSLVCLDPWTGEELWTRTDIALNSDLFSDFEHVYVISPDDKSLNCYRLVDGGFVAKHVLPPELINRVATNGPHLISLREVDDQSLLFGYRLRATGVEKIWSRRLDIAAKANKVNEFELAILEPTGAFEVLRIDSGKSILKHSIKLNRPFSTIQVLKTKGRYLLFVNQNNQNLIEAKKVDLIGKPRQQINIRGEMHYLDHSGSRWQSPVRLDGFDFILNQPEETPVWLLRKEDRSSKSTEIVFVRESDGSSIEFSKPIGRVGATSTVRFEPDKNRVVFNFGYRLLQLEITDHPRPVQPPAQTGRYSLKPDAAKRMAAEQARKAIRDLFLNDDLDRSDLNLLEKWVEAEWKQNPLNRDSRRNR